MPPRPYTKRKRSTSRSCSPIKRSSSANASNSNTSAAATPTVTSTSTKKSEVRNLFKTKADSDDDSDGDVDIEATLLQKNKEGDDGLKRRGRKSSGPKKKNSNLDKLESYLDGQQNDEEEESQVDQQLDQPQSRASESAVSSEAGVRKSSRLRQKKERFGESTSSTPTGSASSPSTKSKRRVSSRSQQKKQAEVEEFQKKSRQSQSQQLLLIEAKSSLTTERGSQSQAMSSGPQLDLLNFKQDDDEDADDKSEDRLDDAPILYGNHKPEGIVTLTLEQLKNEPESPPPPPTQSLQSQSNEMPSMSMHVVKLDEIKQEVGIPFPIIPPGSALHQEQQPKSFVPLEKVKEDDSVMITESPASPTGSPTRPGPKSKKGRKPKGKGKVTGQSSSQAGSSLGNNIFPSSSSQVPTDLAQALVPYCPPVPGSSASTGSSPSATSSSRHLEKYSALPPTEQVVCLVRDLENQIKINGVLQQDAVVSFNTKNTLMKENEKLRLSNVEYKMTLDKEKKRAEDAWKRLDQTRLYNKVNEEGAEQRYFLSQKYSDAIEEVKRQCQDRLKELEKDRSKLAKENQILNRKMVAAGKKYNRYKKKVSRIQKGLIASITTVLWKMIEVGQPKKKRREFTLQKLKELIAKNVKEACLQIQKETEEETLQYQSQVSKMFAESFEESSRCDFQDFLVERTLGDLKKIWRKAENDDEDDYDDEKMEFGSSSPAKRAKIDSRKMKEKTGNRQEVTPSEEEDEDEERMQQNAKPAFIMIGKENVLPLRPDGQKENVQEKDSDEDDDDDDDDDDFVDVAEEPPQVLAGLFGQGSFHQFQAETEEKGRNEQENHQKNDNVVESSLECPSLRRASASATSLASSCSLFDETPLTRSPNADEAEVEVGRGQFDIGPIDMKEFFGGGDDEKTQEEPEDQSGSQFQLQLKDFKKEVESLSEEEDEMCKDAMEAAQMNTAPTITQTQLEESNDNTNDEIVVAEKTLVQASPEKEKRAEPIHVPAVVESCKKGISEQMDHEDKRAEPIPVPAVAESCKQGISEQMDHEDNGVQMEEKDSRYSDNNRNERDNNDDQSNVLRFHAGIEANDGEGEQSNLHALKKTTSEAEVEKEGELVLTQRNAKDETDTSQLVKSNDVLPIPNSSPSSSSSSQSATGEEGQGSEMIEYVQKWDSDKDEQKTPPMIILPLEGNRGRKRGNRRSERESNTQRDRDRIYHHRNYGQEERSPGNSNWRGRGSGGRGGGHSNSRGDYGRGQSQYIRGREREGGWGRNSSSFSSRSPVDDRDRNTNIRSRMAKDLTQIRPVGGNVEGGEVACEKMRLEKQWKSMRGGKRDERMGRNEQEHEYLSASRYHHQEDNLPHHQCQQQSIRHERRDRERDHDRRSPSPSRARDPRLRQRYEMKDLFGDEDEEVVPYQGQDRIRSGDRISRSNQQRADFNFAKYRSDRRGSGVRDNNKADYDFGDDDDSYGGESDLSEEEEEYLPQEKTRHAHNSTKLDHQKKNKPPAPAPIEKTTEPHKTVYDTVRDDLAMSDDDEEEDSSSSNESSEEDDDGSTSGSGSGESRSEGLEDQDQSGYNSGSTSTRFDDISPASPERPSQEDGDSNDGGKGRGVPSAININPVVQKYMDELINIPMTTLLDDKTKYLHFPSEFCTVQELAAYCYSLATKSSHAHLEMDTMKDVRLSQCPLIPRFGTLLAIMRDAAAMYKKFEGLFAEFGRLFTASLTQEDRKGKGRRIIENERLMVHIGRLFGAIVGLRGKDKVDIEDVIVTMAGVKGPYLYSFLFGLLANSNNTVLGFIPGVSRWESLELWVRSVLVVLVKGPSFSHSKWREICLELIKSLGLLEVIPMEISFDQFLTVALDSISELESARGLQKGAKIIGMLVGQKGWQWFVRNAQQNINRFEEKWKNQKITDGAFGEAILKGFGIAVSWMRRENLPDSIDDVKILISRYVGSAFPQTIREAANSTMDLLNSVVLRNPSMKLEQWSYARKESSNRGKEIRTGNKKKSIKKRKRQREQRKLRKQQVEGGGVKTEVPHGRAVPGTSTTVTATATAYPGESRKRPNRLSDSSDDEDGRDNKRSRRSGGAGGGDHGYGRGSGGGGRGSSGGHPPGGKLQFPGRKNGDGRRGRGRGRGRPRKS